MRTSKFLAFCVLSCFCSKIVLCDVIVQKGTSVDLHQCLNVSMQVEKTGEDNQTVTQKINASGVSQEILNSISNQPGVNTPSQYSIRLNFKSLNLKLNLHVEVIKCDKNNKSEYGKILAREDGIQISLEYNSSVTDSYHSSADSTMTSFQWITWPIKSLANKIVIVCSFWIDMTLTVLYWVTWPVRALINVVVAAYTVLVDLCSSLVQTVKRPFNDPIKVMESVLGAIWMVASPFVRAVVWVCEMIITVKRYIKSSVAIFLEKYPGVLEVVTRCKMIRERLSKLLSLWPWNWMDSIEYIGFTWVILYFSYALMKFAMMDERQMLRMARRTDRNSFHKNTFKKEETGESG